MEVVVAYGCLVGEGEMETILGELEGCRESVLLCAEVGRLAAEEEREPKKGEVVGSGDGSGDSLWCKARSLPLADLD
jgi:hypothetical protein